MVSSREKKKKYYRPFLYFAFMFFLAPSAVSPRDHPITAREVGKFMNIGHLCLPASELGVFSFFCSLFSSFLIKKITKCLQMIKEWLNPKSWVKSMCKCLIKHGCVWIYRWRWARPALGSTEGGGQIYKCVAEEKCAGTGVINYRCGNVVWGNAVTVTGGTPGESWGRGDAGNRKKRGRSPFHHPQI